MLIFNEERHTYTHSVKKIQYKGATTFLKCVEKPYNTDYWTSYKAVEWFYLIKPENDSMPKTWFLLKDLLKEEYNKGTDNDHKEQLRTEAIKKFINNSYLKYKILTKKQFFQDTWDTKRIKSCEKGTEFHKKKENIRIDELNGIQTIEDDLDDLLDGKIISNPAFQIPQTDTGDKIAVDIRNLEFSKWYPEVIVYNDNLELCGTVDDLMLENIDSKIIININDWKTNEKIEVNNHFKNYLLPPVSHLMECNYNKYRLQLSFYYYLITLVFGEENCIPGIIMFTHVDDFGIETQFKFKPLIKEIKDIIKIYGKAN